MEREQLHQPRFEPQKAGNLKVRSDLMIALAKLIDDRGLTQTAAAGLRDVTQPRISDLVLGKIDRFSVDSLIEMLGSCWGGGFVRDQGWQGGNLTFLERTKRPEQSGGQKVLPADFAKDSACPFLKSNPNANALDNATCPNHHQVPYAYHLEQ
ncbi:MAG: helix-turn-helix transcriptional regulator [Acidobacteriota bacterium]|nr:helix-turn-helix transcriptional regulator [Acidobacteriota bacterium]